MSDTTDVTSGVSDVADDGASATGTAKRRRSGTGLSAKLLPELQSLAASLGISGTARMRKGELISAISERQDGGAAAGGASQTRPANGVTGPVREASSAVAEAAAAAVAAPAVAAEAAPRAERAASAPRSRQRTAEREAGSAGVVTEVRGGDGAVANGPTGQQTAETKPFTVSQAALDNEVRRGGRNAGEQTPEERPERSAERPERGESRSGRDRGDRQRNSRSGGGAESAERAPRTEQAGAAGGSDGDDNDESEGSRRSRRSRFRDRRRGRGDRDGAEAGGGRDGGRDSSSRDSGGRDSHATEDEVLVPVAGILDVLDNYAFV
ncbi:MAG TPA: Rho termination factor N-terminal domain-containing protein, partial [Actinoplanes sp.]|nr:Rho termination factor N-terminal domain-containing protein [Actinoplanes sp.]